MSSRSFAQLLGLLSLAFIFSSCEKQELILREESIDLGVAVPGESKSFEISVRNPTERDIAIVAAETSCSCISKDLFPILIDRGGVAELSFEILSGNFERSVSYEIVLKTSEGDVLGPVSLELEIYDPINIAKTRISPAEVQRNSLVPVSTDEGVIRSIAAKSSSEFIETKVENQGGNWTILLGLAGEPPSGMWEEKVTLKLSLNDEREVTRKISISGMHPGERSASPMFVISSPGTRRIVEVEPPIDDLEKVSLSQRDTGAIEAYIQNGALTIENIRLPSGGMAVVYLINASGNLELSIPVYSMIK